MKSGLGRRSAIVVGLLLLASGALYWYQKRIKTLADAASWFKVQTVAEGAWRIDDNGGDNVYLVTGRDSALLVDTGTGSADLLACVRQLTALPLTVVNTHGHPDHAGGNFHFAEVRAHPDDVDMILTVVNDARLVTRLLRWVHGVRRSAFERRQLVPVKAGQIIDLGGRRIEVIETPGHTKGSVCLLDASHKLLFAGDNDNTLVWLFLKGGLPIEAYLKTLQALQKRAGEYETILPGHGTPLDSAFIGEQITCAESILSGACEGEPYPNPFWHRGARVLLQASQHHLRSREPAREIGRPRSARLRQPPYTSAGVAAVNRARGQGRCQCRPSWGRGATTRPCLVRSYAHSRGDSLSGLVAGRWPAAGRPRALRLIARARCTD